MYSNPDQFSADYPGYNNWTDLEIANRLDRAQSIVDSIVGRGYDLPLCTSAVWTVSVSGTCSEDDTLTIGGVEYTMKAAPSGDTEIDIGADAAETAQNIASALSRTPWVTSARDGADVALTARQEGSVPNGWTMEVDSADLSLAVTTAGVRRFRILETCELQLAAARIIRGEHDSPVESGGTGYADALHKEAMDLLKSLVAQKADSTVLVDDDDGARVIREDPGMFEIDMFSEEEAVDSDIY